MTKGKKRRALRRVKKKSELEMMLAEVHEEDAQPRSHTRILSQDEIDSLLGFEDEPAEAIPLLLWCPDCRARHIDESPWDTKPHHTHACQHCGHVWRPAIVETVGVRFLPGFKNED